MRQTVGAVGNRTRYQSGAYECTREREHDVKLSGTAIISSYYRLKRELEAVFLSKGKVPWTCYLVFGWACFVSETHINES